MFHTYEIGSAQDSYRDRPKTEGELKEAVEPSWMEWVFRGLTDAVMATDQRGRIVAINPAAEVLTGVSRKAAIGAPIREVFRLAKPAPQIPMPHALIPQSAPRRFYHVVLLSRHDRRTVVDAIYTVLRGGESVQGSLLVFRDVSQTVAEQRTRLDHQKNEAIAMLARSVATEFNNWLGVISGHASSIADNLIPNTRAHEDALRILHVVGEAGSLTKRLLSVARATHVRNETHSEKVVIEEVIRDALSLAEGLFLQSKVEVAFDTRDGTHGVSADTGQLLDCLLNLFMNAAEAMRGGGKLSIAVEEKTAGGKPYAVIRVQDTGVGMTREVIDHIFEPFFSTKKEQGTRGLGLTIVQSSIQKWGGFVRVRSIPSQGTTFRLFLPAADMETPRTRELSTARSPRERILLVDDNESELASAASTLRTAGYRVVTARNAPDAVSLFRQRADRFDLSLLDVIMPGMDGKYVLNEILKVDPTASIIMMSGFSRDYVRTHLERGAWAFIQKPFEPAQLLATVRRVFEQRSQQSQASP